MGCLIQSSGVWYHSGGAQANFLYFTKGNEAPEISKIYFDAESLQNLGCNVSNLANYARPYNRIIDCLVESPASELTKEVFGNFIASLQVKDRSLLSEEIQLKHCLSLDGVKKESYKLAKENEAVDNGSFSEEGVEDVNLNINIQSDEEIQDDYLEEDNYTEEIGQDEHWREDESASEEESRRERKTRRRERKNFEEPSTRKYAKRKPYPPTLSEKRFLTRCQDLGRHENLDEYYSLPFLDKGTISCRVCRKQFTSSIVQRASLRICLIDRVIDHILVKHFKSWAYQCDICEATFNSPKPWKDHVRSNCEQTSLTQIGKFVCKKCKDRYETKEDLQEHVTSVHDGQTVRLLICSTCGLMFKTEKCRVDHEKRIHKIVYAPEKSKQKRDRNLPNGGAARVVCPTCGLECCTKWVLENHIKKWHENAFPEPRICQLCVKPDSSNFSRRKYYTPYSLEKHMSEYHGEECHQIICEHCSEVFKGGINQAKRSLRAHIDKVHLGIKHECDVCGKVFLTDKTLSSHKRHVHRKEGKYPCKECGRIFGYYLQAIEHAYKDRGEAPHQCKFCDFKSAHSWALSKHRPLCKFKGIPREFSREVEEATAFATQKFTIREFLPHRLENPL